MILNRHPDQGLRTERAIGYFRPLDAASVACGGHGDRAYLPDVRDFVDETWDAGERETVAAYLDAGKDVIQWRGSSQCRFCGRRNGSSCRSDSHFIWPEGFSHYLREHGVKPPAEFVSHVLFRTDPVAMAAAQAKLMEQNRLLFSDQARILKEKRDAVRAVRAEEVAGFVGRARKRVTQ